MMLRDQKWNRTMKEAKFMNERDQIWSSGKSNTSVRRNQQRKRLFGSGEIWLLMV